MCDQDVIALLCVGLPMIAYAVFLGFIPRNVKELGEAIKSCNGNGTNATASNGKGIIACLAENEHGKVFVVISAVALICIIYGIVVQVLKCIVCCCCCGCCGCCGCVDCFLKYAFRIGVGVGYPSLADFLTYLITAIVAQKDTNNHFNMVIGGYSGLSMVSLAAGWVFTIVIGSFFIKKDSCCLKFLGLVLGCVVAFVVISAIAGADPRGYHSTDSKALWGGVVLGFVDVIVFTAMYAAALCYLSGGGCCK